MVVDRNVKDSEFSSMRWPMKKIIIALIVISLLLISGAAAKRKAPAELPPLILDNIKYVVPHWGGETGRGQSGGYIEARDAKTDTLLWVLKIYTIKYKPKLERDVQDIFITKMELYNNKLLIWNERNDKFTVDLKTRAVKPKNKFYP
jgi:hypothetical protein